MEPVPDASRTAARRAAIEAALASLVATDGPTLLDAPHRLRARLAQARPDAPGHVAAIVDALRANVPRRLRAAMDRGALPAGLQDAVRLVGAEGAHDPALATWAVRAWAHALALPTTGLADDMEDVEDAVPASAQDDTIGRMTVPTRAAPAGWPAHPTTGPIGPGITMGWERKEEPRQPRPAWRIASMLTAVVVLALAVVWFIGVPHAPDDGQAPQATATVVPIAPVAAPVEAPPRSNDTPALAAATPTGPPVAEAAPPPVAVAGPPPAASARKSDPPHARVVAAAASKRPAPRDAAPAVRKPADDGTRCSAATCGTVVEARELAPGTGSPLYRIVVRMDDRQTQAFSAAYRLQAGTRVRRVGTGFVPLAAKAAHDTRR